MNCEMCGGLMERLGRLGQFVWWKCRDCGWEMHGDEWDELLAEGWDEVDWGEEECE